MVSCFACKANIFATFCKLKWKTAWGCTYLPTMWPIKYDLGLTSRSQRWKFALAWPQMALNQWKWMQLYIQCYNPPPIVLWQLSSTRTSFVYWLVENVVAGWKRITQNGYLIVIIINDSHLRVLNQFEVWDVHSFSQKYDDSW